MLWLLYTVQECKVMEDSVHVAIESLRRAWGFLKQH